MRAFPVMARALEYGEGLPLTLTLFLLLTLPLTLNRFFSFVWEGTVKDATGFYQRLKDFNVAVSTKSSNGNWESGQ